MRVNYLAILGLSTALLLTACATSNTDDEVAQAKTNFAQQNYQLAFKQIQAPAEQGDPESQYALGYMYYYGKGTPMNHLLGKEWIKKAADGGDSNAQQAYQMIITQEQQNLTPPNNNITEADGTITSTATPAPMATTVPAAIPPVATSSVGTSSVATPMANTAMQTIAVNTTALTADQRAILKAPGHEYTLQLANAPSASAANSYVQRYHLGKAAKIYSRDINGKKTYTVIYGHYPSRSAALKALHKLPASIQKAKPWPRTLNSIQAEIDKNR